MLHLVTERNRSLYEQEMAALHRARKAVFVDELGWRLRVVDGMEFDEYDDARAMHIVGFDEDHTIGPNRAISMSLRMRPADDRCMLLDHFAHHLPRRMRPTNDGSTWEVSRGFSLERGLSRAALKRKAACMIAPLEVALSAGVDRYVGFTDVRMLGLYYHVGWKLNLLGEPQSYGEGIGVAYEAEVSSRVIADIRRTWGLPAPAYVELHELSGAGSVHEAAERLIASKRPSQDRVTPTAAPATSHVSATLAALMKKPMIAGARSDLRLQAARAQTQQDLRPRLTGSE